MSEFDRSRLSNAGKEAARVHRQMRKIAMKLVALTEEASAAGLSSHEMEDALLRFCRAEEVTDAASLYMAALQVQEKEQARASR